jgi:hypothetical protein
MPDPLDIIAESYRSIVQSTASLNATTNALRRQQGVFFVLLGLLVLGVAAILWHAIVASHEHAALVQNLTLQTEALRRVLQR